MALVLTLVDSMALGVVLLGSSYVLGMLWV